MPAVERLCEDAVWDLLKIEASCFGDEQWNESMLCAEFQNPLAELYGIKIGDKVVAYLSVRIIFDEAHISNIAVLPEHRGKGYAKKLLAALFKSCKKQGVKSFTLEVNVNNIAAITLYESFGFKRAGRRNQYYKSGDDAYVMWKTE